MTAMSTDKPRDKPQVLRETDDEARRLARILVRGARYMALAVIEPETGFPSASRALTATDLDGVPVILASFLSGHTKGVLADPRCSLLAGEPGKGDPLAHPRITIQCLAEVVERESAPHALIRERFLDRHPKAALYVDFPDFRFFRLVPQSASLNGGFGRAYALAGPDLVFAESFDPPDWLDLQRKLREMTELASSVAAHVGGGNESNWRFGGVDPCGIDLISANRQVRHEFPTGFSSVEAAFYYISGLSETNEQSIPPPEI